LATPWALQKSVDPWREAGKFSARPAAISRRAIATAYNFCVTDRFLFQLGVVALVLGVAMIAIPWLGIASAAVMLVASLLAYWRLRRASPRDPSHAPAGQRA
jgi:hypothetical protein